MFVDVEKETGFGWLVVACSSFLHVIVCGIAYSCGVIHHIFRNYFNQPSHFMTSWIGTTLLAMTMLAGVPGTLLTYKVGYRPTVIIGGLMSAGGLALSAFCTEFWQVLLTFGVMTGIGFGLSLAPSVMIVECYFFERRSLATGFVFAGASVGVMFVPIMVHQLEEQFAWKGMALILSGCALNLVSCGASYRMPGKPASPVLERKQRESLLKIFKIGLFRSEAFVAMCFSNVFWSLGSVIVFTYLPGYASFNGQSLDGATTLIGVIGLSTAVSRPMFQLFGQSAQLDHASVLLCSVGLTAILTGLHDQMMTHAAGQIGYAIIFGLHAGFMTSLVTLLSGDLVGEEYLAWGRGYLTMSVVAGAVAGPPLAGWILDITDEDYEIVFYLAGASMMMSSCILAITNMKKCYFRPTADWCDSDSESSATSSTKPSNTCAEEDILQRYTIQTGRYASPLNTTPRDDCEVQVSTNMARPAVVTCPCHVTRDAKTPEPVFRYSAFLSAPETDV